MDILKHKTLLYAEDDIATQKLYGAHFKRLFKAVYLADDGRQALDTYLHEKPDVVILDIIMPYVSGLEVCREIRSSDQEIKIMMLTSCVDKEALMTAIELNLTAYLEKPVTRGKLRASLQKVVQAFHKESHVELWLRDQKQWYWDTLKRELFCDIELITLTKKEKSLLELLLNSRQSKLNYHQIYPHVWAEDYRKDYDEASVKTLIKCLRAKLPQDSIKNVYGLGFYLDIV